MAISNATGGNGGINSGTIGTPGRFVGNANASATATSAAGPATATSAATAGSTVVIGQPGGTIPGVATASGSATTVGAGQALATATADGLSGNASVTAHGSSSAVRFLTTTAQAPAGGSVTAQGSADVGGVVLGAASGIASGLNSFAYATGFPVAAALAGTVGAAFGRPGAAVLGQQAMGATYAAGETGTRDYQSQIAYRFNARQLAGPGRLTIGFLDHDMTGAGFGSLEFSVVEDKSKVFDETFTSLDAANAFFDDTVLGLGTVDPRAPSGLLDVVFDLDVEADAPGSYGADFVLGETPLGTGPGAVPEPGTLALFLVGAVGSFATLARRKTRHPVSI